MSTMKPFQRLPTNITPINYDLLLTPDVTKRSFQGHQKISINISEPTSKIVLNSIEIVISPEDLFVVCGEKSIKAKNVEYSIEDETATLQFGETLPVGEATLDMKFTGILNEMLRGFYYSAYIDADGKKRDIASTQFEPVSARQAFPCWDEPALKATFDISYLIPDDGRTIGLSNMNIIKEESIEGSLKKICFARTPIMSTYLVAFVIGEFEFIETFTEDGVCVRVYTPIGKKEHGRFGLEVCKKSLDFYREYFKIPYPLKKMDLIPIPNFHSGAMENWGLITFRETTLLIDPLNSSTFRKQCNALVIAHEIAHQWFGNLVTMEWWTHLWLNEGFASFIEYLCVDKLFPEFDIWKQFVSGTFLTAMTDDGLDSSHPIEIAVGHPSEIDEIFDNISYDKGASVIRMLHNFLSDEIFRKGMNLYLSRHSYKNTETEMLWDALEEASGRPVRRMMSTWTKQKGYPIVSVSQSGTQVVLRQEKFRMVGPLSDEDAKMLWSIPIQIITSESSNTITLGLFETKEMTLTLEPNSWFKLNPSSICTYRVFYSSELLDRLIEAIQKGSLSSLDRLNILDDYFALVLAGKAKTVDFLKLLLTFQNETDYTVWRTLSLCLSKFNQLFYGLEFYPKYRSFCRSLLNKTIYPKIGWEAKPDEPYLDTLIRPLIIGQLVLFGDVDVMSECKKRFHNLLNGTSIPADLRIPVYKAMAIQADEEVFGQLLKLYSKSELLEEQNRISASLGSCQDPELIKRVLDFSISDQVRSQDTVSVIGNLAFNPKGRDAAWSFFQNKKQFFSSRYGSGFILSYLVKSITENFTSEAHAQEVDEFFQKNPFSGVERSIQQSIENIRLSSSILQRDAKEVARFFDKL